ncbi:uncharacterized protein with HEPN domain [Roseiarcus fermentans]|uniref:Uncharacterized protein with HEPN domain n=1 Tax=Roseiarcus fermentans TaxID=1473586 RepID=A0A366FF10_9HYPH|nr:DUF86 domain-containing protein [Roseiarcus fermentans]RBP12315.1 uncharacterized protein with HEPN domain [Roseiarcus fermentans]
MNDDRLADFLDHMSAAANDACSFVEGMSKREFLADKRTQQAVVMSLVIIGEAAAKIMDKYGDFAAVQPTIPWRGMRGMRNRIAHGYFDVDLGVVWDTVQTALPKLSTQLRQLRNHPLA